MSQLNEYILYRTLLVRPFRLTHEKKMFLAYTAKSPPVF